MKTYQLENQPVLSNQAIKRKILQEKKQKKENAWFKVAVKVIHWRSGNISDTLDKISEKEWRVYVSKILKSSERDKSSTKVKLKETEKIIKDFGGFCN